MTQCNKVPNFQIWIIFSLEKKESLKINLKSNQTCSNPIKFQSAKFIKCFLIKTNAKKNSKHTYSKKMVTWWMHKKKKKKKKERKVDYKTILTNQWLIKLPISLTTTCVP